MPWDDRWYGYPESRPKKAKGGIKAQSSRGAFGKNWWAKRWISVLESFDIGERLGRGRPRAREIATSCVGIPVDGPGCGGAYSGATERA